MNNINSLSSEKGMKQIQDIYEADYWAKKYGVSSEELKKSKNGKDLPAKIVAAHIKEKSLAV